MTLLVTPRGETPDVRAILFALYCGEWWRARQESNL